MHHFKKEYTFSSNVKSLTLLFKKVVVVVTVMKKIYKKPAPALINLNWETQLKNFCVLKIEIALDSGCFSECKKALWKWDVRDILCKNEAIYLPNNTALKTEIMKCYYNNLHIKHYT